MPSGSRFGSSYVAVSRDGRRIEQHEIGPIAFLDATAIDQPERFGGQRRHPPHRFLEPEHAALAHVTRQHARKGAEQTRMRAAAQVRNAVRADHHVAVPQVRLDVGFVDDEVNADRPIAERRGENLLDEFRDVDAAFRRDVDQHAAFVFAKRRAARDADHFGERAIDAFEIEVLDHAAAAGRVRIHVERHRLTGGHRRVDARERLVHLAPVRLAGALVMRDVQMHAALRADPQRLLDRFEQSIAFVAHVGGVETVERLHRLREFDHLFGVAPASRAIDQSRRKAARALLHRALHVAAHRREFGGGRSALLHAHRHRAHGVVADQHQVVDARLAFERGGEVAAQIGELAAQPREDAAARGDRVPPGSAGIALKPQLPLTTVVTPCASLNSMPG